ncbi:MAG: response regulator [Anaerolineales bacterium]|nr:response regulator [Anaerolineales bacterium]
MEVTKILLVDDEPLVRRSLEKTLLRAGFDVETAQDCNSGLDTFTQAITAGAPFDFAILDINMPNFEGVEANGAGLELLSKLVEKKPDLSAIMLTAYDEVNKAKDAVQRGAKAYFVKGREKGLVELINDIMDA